MKYFLTLSVFIVLSCTNQNIQEEDYFKNIYSISSSGYNVEKYLIEENQNLSDILTLQGIDYLTIDQIVKNSKDVYDVRKMRAGNPYFVLSSKDTLQTPQKMIYERNPIEFVVFNLIDSLNVYHGSKNIKRDTVHAIGKIDGSLWLTMIENNHDPELAIELSEMYAWTIDLFGLYQNDEYRIIYEKMYADTQYIGIGDIIATSFIHINEPYYAFLFEQDSLNDYFDEEGGSLRRAFLKAPLRFSRISSRFSYSRKHPILKIRRPHLGIDYVAPIGTPVHSVGDGIVVNASRRGQAGRKVTVKHNGTYTTQYMHLSRYGTGIKQGARVMQGQIVGFVGSSGLSTGPHLDFRFYKNGQAVDPLKVKSPPVKPVKSENMELFKTKVKYWKNYLDSMVFSSDFSQTASESL